MKNFFTKILLVFMLACTNASNVECSEKLQLPFSFVHRDEFDDMFSKWMNEKKDVRIEDASMDLSRAALREVMWLVVALETEALADKNGLDRFTHLDIEREIQHFLLELREVLPLSEWKQAHYNFMALCGVIVGELFKDPKSPYHDLAPDLENYLECKWFDDKYRCKSWGENVKYEKEEIEKAKKVAKQWMKEFDLLGFFKKYEKEIFVKPLERAKNEKVCMSKQM